MEFDASKIVENEKDERRKKRIDELCHQLTNSCSVFWDPAQLSLGFFNLPSALIAMYENPFTDLATASARNRFAYFLMRPTPRDQRE